MVSRCWCPTARAVSCSWRLKICLAKIPKLFGLGKLRTSPSNLTLHPCLVVITGLAAFPNIYSNTSTLERCSAYVYCGGTTWSWHPQWHVYIGVPPTHLRRDNCPLSINKNAFPEFSLSSALCLSQLALRLTLIPPQYLI